MSAHHTKRLSVDPDTLSADIDKTLDVMITTETQLAKHFAKQVAVVLLTSGETEASISELIQVGVRAILPTDAPVRLLTGTLDLLSEGIQIMPRIDGVIRALNMAIVRALNIHVAPREIAVIRLVMSGKSNADIASELGLTLGTVKNYVTSAMRKLDFSNRTELALWGIESGLRPGSTPKYQMTK
jgi:DNA-binding NarL/FixJ family response regulator